MTTTCAPASYSTFRTSSIGGTLVPIFTVRSDSIVNVVCKVTVKVKVAQEFKGLPVLNYRVARRRELTH